MSQYTDAKIAETCDFLRWLADSVADSYRRRCVDAFAIIEQLQAENKRYKQAFVGIREGARYSADNFIANAKKDRAENDQLLVALQKANAEIERLSGFQSPAVVKDSVTTDHLERAASEMRAALDVVGQE